MPSCRFFIGICLLFLMQACASPGQQATKEKGPESQSKEAGSYGAAINPEGAVPVAQLPILLEGKDSAEVKVVGTVLESCRMKGCWMQVALPNSPPMRVTFQDYAYFVPKNLNGETVIMEGMAHWKTTSVADLQHYAEDAGKSAAEIAAITNPERTLSLVAKGVLIQQ